MTVYDLSEDQKHELKCEMLEDKLLYKPSFKDYGFADALISDRELFEKYKDETFSDKDFIVSR